MEKNMGTGCIHSGRYLQGSLYSYYTLTTFLAFPPLTGSPSGIMRCISGHTLNAMRATTNISQIIKGVRCRV